MLWITFQLRLMSSAQDTVWKEFSVYLTVLFICIQQSGYLVVPIPGPYFQSDNITVRIYI